MARIWLDGHESRPDLVPERPVLERYLARVVDEAHPFGVWVVTSAGDHVVAWGALMPCRNHPFVRERFAEVAFYVTPEQRQRGVGKQLVEHLMETADDRGFEHTMAWCSSSNVPAIRTLRGVGALSIAQVEPSGLRRYPLQALLLRPHGAVRSERT
jgi:L-amino acid N-acyltransferase YncA